MTQLEAKARIVTKIGEIARSLGKNAAGMSEEAVVMETGLLDSAGLLELLVWMDSEFGVDVDPGEITVENFGSVAQMAQYVADRGASR